jgi:uncharacterized protein (DUF58 family)
VRRLLKRYTTGGGRAVLGIASASMLAGLDPFRTHLGGLFVVLLALLTMSFLLGLFYRRKLRGEWRAPIRVVCGTRFPVAVKLRNMSRGNAYEVEAAFDSLPRGLWQRVEEPGENRAGLIPPGESRSLEIKIKANKRGAYTLGPLWAGTTFPFGIFRFSSKVSARHRVLVTPRIHDIASLSLNPGLRYQPGGVPMASETGESLEFMGVREYRQGDSLRKIHWKLWARQGTPVVREFSQEYFSRVGVILDTYKPPKGEAFERATEVAASISNYLARQDAIVDFFAVGSEVYFLSVGRQLGTLQNILDVLACVEPSKKSPYEKLEHQLLDVLAALSAVVVVTFDPSPQRRRFWERLKLGGAPLRVFCVGKGEDEPDVTWLDPAQMPACLEHM